MKIIDGHCHIGKGFDVSFSAERLIEDMDKNKITKAIVCPMDRYITVYNREGNDYVLQAIKKFPDRLIGFATVNPWYGGKAEEELKRAISLGLRGLKLNPSLQGFLLNDRLVYPLMEIAERLNIPVYFHTGTPIHSLPFQLSDLAVRYPQVKMVMGHMADTDFWNDVVHVIKERKNIFLDTSLVNNISLVKKSIEMTDAERVFYSSNTPFSPMSIEIRKIKLVSSDRNILRKVFMDNVLKFLNMSL